MLAGSAESVPAFALKNELGFTSEDVVVVGKGTADPKSSSVSPSEL